MKIKDPSIRSCYSHPLLSKIEEDVDDHRDSKGCSITEDEFQEIVSKYQAQVPDESELLYDLAHENFLEEDTVPFLENEDEFEGCDGVEFPSYDSILSTIALHSDEMWEAYDKEVHEFCRQMCYNITNKENIIELGTNIALYQLSFDEESCVCMHTILFVLKTIVPWKINSKFQNSIKRVEIWLHEAMLM